MDTKPVIWLMASDLPSFSAAEREKEYVEWYKGTHIPLALKAPGILKGDFYERIEPTEEYPKYLCVYQIENEGAITKARASTEMSRAIKDGRTHGPAFGMGIRWRVHYRPIG